MNIKKCLLQIKNSKILIEFIETNGDLEKELEGVFRRDEMLDSMKM
jgi:hypothetical protein